MGKGSEFVNVVVSSLESHTLLVLWRLSSAVPQTSVQNLAVFSWPKGSNATWNWGRQTGSEKGEILGKCTQPLLVLQ